MKIILFICLLYLAQEINAQKKGFPIRLLAGNEATAIPFNKLLSKPFHPLFQVGTEFGYNSNTHHYLYQTANMGYMYHKHLFRGVYLNSELGYDYRLGFGINLKALAGLGYLHTFSVNEEYSLVDGKYQSRRDTGNARLMPSFSLGVGYRTQKKNPASPEIMLLYRSWLEFPYSPGFISLMSHTDLSIGVKIFIH